MKVYYSGGVSRNGNCPVNYMLLTLDDDEELYAEYELTDDLPDRYDEDEGYDELKAEIIEQAREHGIDPAELEFWYD